MLGYKDLLKRLRRTKDDDTPANVCHMLGGLSGATTPSVAAVTAAETDRVIAKNTTQCSILD